MSPIRDRAKTGLGPTNVFHWFWFRSRGFIVSSSFYTSGQSSSAAVAATEPAAEPAADPATAVAATEPAAE